MRVILKNDYSKKRINSKKTSNFLTQSKIYSQKILAKYYLSPPKMKNNKLINFNNFLPKKKIQKKRKIISSSELIGLNRTCKKISSNKQNIKYYMCLKVETTGLIGRYLNSSSIPRYDRLEFYEGARVICIKWIIYEDREGIPINLKEIMIFNPNFEISDLNNQIHKLTSDDLQNYGIPINEALNEFMRSVNFVQLIIAHNIQFHLNVIKSELFRLGRMKDINQITKKLRFCTAKDTKELFPNPKYNEKIHKYYQPGLKYVPKYLKKSFENLCIYFLGKKAELREYLEFLNEVALRLKELKYIDF